MHLFCAAIRTHRWFAHDQKIKKKQTKKNKNIYSIRALFSYVLWNQHRKHHDVQSETRKLSQGTNENSDKQQGNCLKRGKTWMTERKKKKPKQKPVFSSATIFNRPLLHLTNSLVPKYCERRITLEKRRFPKHIFCEEESRVFLEYFMSVTHDVLSGMSYVPCARVLMPWGRQQLRTQFEYKRAQVTYDGHYRRCLSTEKGTENGLSEVLRVLVM